MEIVEIIISTIISTGIITAFISHQYDKKIKAHELKLDRYMALIDVLSKVTANQEGFEKLCPLLNGALLYASDEVVLEILLLNQVFTKAQESKKPGNNNFQITFEQMRPLFEAIRKDLYLGSNAFKKIELRFFMKP